MKVIIVPNADFSAHKVMKIAMQTISCSGVTLPTIGDLKYGESTKLVAAVSPSNTTDAITWSSSNTSVATIDNEGNLKVVGVGDCSITVTCGSKTATKQLTIIPAVSGIQYVIGRGQYKSSESNTFATTTTSTNQIASGVLNGYCYIDHKTGGIEYIDLCPIIIPSGFTKIRIKSKSGYGPLMTYYDSSRVYTQGTAYVTSGELLNGKTFDYSGDVVVTIPTDVVADAFSVTFRYNGSDKIIPSDLDTSDWSFSFEN